MELELNLTSEDNKEAYTTGFALIITDIMEKVMLDYMREGKEINGAILRLEVLKRVQAIYNPMSTIMVMIIFSLVDVFIASCNDYEESISNNTTKLYS